MDESEAGMKIAGRNIKNLRYADDITFMAESKEVLTHVYLWRIHFDIWQI